jgi:hypothetical protein
VVDCVIATSGLYGTAPTCYLSLVARLPGFVREDLDRALYEDRTLLRMRALRGSSFMIPIEMIDTVVSAEDRKGWYGQYVEKIIDVKGREKLTREVLDVLKGRVMATREIREELALEGDRAEALKYLMSMLSGQQLIATATVIGGWRSNQYGYALWEEWLPDAPRQEVDPEQARIDVARWFLGGHGPATVDDFKWWGGFKKTNARAALEASGAVTVDTPLGEMFDLADRPEPVTSEGLRLLPVWDTALVSQADRRRMVDEADRHFVYDVSGNTTSTIVHNGAVVGIWDRQGDDARLVVKAAPLPGFDTEAWDLVESEAEVVARALGAPDLDVVRVDDPVDLHQAKRNRFLSPLSGP